MKSLIAFVLFIVFLFLSGIHIYWGLGGKWGADAAIPTKENKEKVMNPKLLECLAVAFGLAGFGVFILIKTQIISMDLPGWLSHYGLWIISIIFVLRAIGDFRYVGFFKKIKTTKFGHMDTGYYSPLCLSIGLLCIALELMK